MGNILNVVLNDSFRTIRDRNVGGTVRTPDAIPWYFTIEHGALYTLMHCKKIVDLSFLVVST